MAELVAGRQVGHVAAGVVAQVWRGDARQHNVARVLKTRAVRVHALNDAVAFDLGRLLAVTGASDVIDAHVASLGQATGGVVLTSDPDDIRAINPDLTIVCV
ncbi:MAG TPA: hypothetical protein VFZ37_02960 [Jiangellaceae bacterium]